MPTKKLLIAVDWYAPGYRAGGPISSCVNLARTLAPHATVGVWTSDRDLGEKTPYDGVQRNVWRAQETGEVAFYASPDRRTLRGFLAAVKEFRPDCVYLNGMFSWPCALGPLTLKARRKLQPEVVLAPRGMLKESAISRRAWKKRPTLAVLRALRMASQIKFHATSDSEAAEVRRHFGDAASVYIAGNIPMCPPKSLSSHAKRKSRLRMTLVGRVHPTKNIDFLLNAMRGVAAKCDLLIIGPSEEHRYQKHCESLAAKLPENIQVKFSGSLPPEATRAHVAASDLFALPTLGENFGHAIFEALSLGAPILISDQTIWRHLATKEAGWDLPLSRPQRFTEVINAVAAMNNQEHDRLRRGAHRFACEYFRQSDFVPEYLRLFGITESKTIEQSTRTSEC